MNKKRKHFFEGIMLGLPVIVSLILFFINIHV